MAPDPLPVFADLVVAIADGAGCASGIGQIYDLWAQHGRFASVLTTRRQ